MAAIYSPQRIGSAVFGAAFGDEGVAVAVAGIAAYTVAGTGAVAGTVGDAVSGTVAGSAAYAVAATGAVVGTLGEIGPAPTLQRGKRIVPVGDPTAPKKLQRMDFQEVDNITFDHASQLLVGESISSAAVTAALHLGADESPTLLLQYTAQINGTDVIQRVRGRVSGATYMLRCVSTLNSGRQLVGAAILPVLQLL